MTVDFSTHTFEILLDELEADEREGGLKLRSKKVRDPESARFPKQSLQKALLAETTNRSNHNI